MSESEGQDSLWVSALYSLYDFYQLQAGQLGGLIKHPDPPLQ